MIAEETSFKISPFIKNLSSNRINNMVTQRKCETLKDAKKTYSKMYASSISHLQADAVKPRKKIILTSKINGLREEFKKTFLPLLIDVFELRQMIENYKLSRSSHSFLSLNNRLKPPAEILTRLQELQNDIEESQRWCQGIVSQISKGIQEAQEALEDLTPTKMPVDKPKKSVFSKNCHKQWLYLCKKKMKRFFNKKKI